MRSVLDEGVPGLAPSHASHQEPSAKPLATAASSTTPPASLHEPQPQS
ncbi:hypothetical protein [Streptomyces sp. NPDC060027]